MTFWPCQTGGPKGSGDLPRPDVLTKGYGFTAALSYNPNMYDAGPGPHCFLGVKHQMDLIHATRRRILRACDGHDRLLTVFQASKRRWPVDQRCDGSLADSFESPCFDHVTAPMTIATSTAQAANFLACRRWALDKQQVRNWH